MQKPDDPTKQGDSGSAPRGASGQSDQEKNVNGDLNDLLQELRVLLQGVQVLVGFLIVLPFSEGFARVSPAEKRVYLVLFLCTLVSLLLFSAPAAQHRLLTPLRDRIQFKKGATRMVVIGMIPLSASMVLATHFVLDQVAGRGVANIASGGVAAIILVLWWIAPLVRRRSSGV